MGRSLLFLVGGLTIITGFIQIQNQERMQSLPEVTSAYFEEQQARNIAKSLIDNAIEHMKVDNSWSDSLTLTEVMNVGSMLTRSTTETKNIVKSLLSGGQTPTYEQQELEEDEILAGMMQSGLSGTLKSYTSSSSYIPPDNNVGTWDEYKLLLISTSTYDDIEVTTEVLMQRDSYSKYSYMTDSELSSSGSAIWFNNGDNIYGPIHTNGTFRMSGTPSFYGLITSPNSWIAHSTNGASPNFHGGENFNAPDKSSPSNYEMNKLVAAANSGGLQFNANLEVNFDVDGDIGYANIREATSASCGWGCTYTQYSDWEEYDLSSFNGIISTSGKVQVEGTVKGAVTIHSEDEIEIVGDILYDTSPLADSSSTDILGLVSEGDVIVDRNAHSASGSQDLTIHASIMALNTSFEVENYNSGVKGTLNILGGLIQRNRGPVGTFNSYGIVSGYSKNYQYDGRLKSTIPPSFPRESVFSIVYWKDEVVKRTD